MTHRFSNRRGRGLLAAVVFVPLAAGAEPPVDFAREIRPILSDRCFKCHGFDDLTREADLGLHTREFATADLGGYRAVEPGNPEKSEIIARMITDDPDDLMPPAKSNKPKLTEKEIALFNRWIAEGAKYEQHWAFLPPVRPEPPAVGADAAYPVRNPIDAFVAMRLKREGLKPSPVADPLTLIRRVSLDLTGLRRARRP
ncbi:MAG: DUF1549 domain-containing protein [Verrucomicrobiae bacterium]|nr:DUF1549 domain-containing protein [Verrucomicrobiae bacterium]